MKHKIDGTIVENSHTNLKERLKYGEIISLNYKGYTLKLKVDDMQVSGKSTQAMKDQKRSIKPEILKEMEQARKSSDSNE